MKSKQIILFLAVIVGLSTFSITPKSTQAADVPSLIFPVLGGATYSDDYGDPRVGGRTHEGNDLMAKKMQPLVAVTDGVVTFLTANEATWGYSITITDKNGYEYNYLHLNNDTPGTDDGAGGYNNAFAPDIERGSRVIAGQRIGFVGDSGNAETTAPHVHFEIRNSSTNSPLNPYPYLKSAKIIYTAVVNDNPTVDNDYDPDWDRGDDEEEEEEEEEPSKTPTGEFYPYEDFEGGATITAGNIDDDSEFELVTGTAFSGGGRTMINSYDINSSKIGTFFAYGDVFRGGGDVASGDIDGDGEEEIITSAGPTGGPHIKVFKSDGKLVSEFMAYGSGFRGGVYVASADIDGDGKAEIVTGPAAGGGPHVKVFDKTGKVLKEFMAYSAGFTGGVDVSAFEPDGKYEGGIVTGPGPGGGPHVKVFDYDLKLVGEFMAYPQSFSGGVRVDSGNPISSNGSMEVVTSPATNSSAHTKVFKTNGTFIKASTTGFESLWAGGADVAIAGRNIYIATSGGRKTTVKKVSF